MRAPSRFHLSVERELQAIPRKPSKWDLEFLQSYMRTELKMLGLSLPVQRALYQRGYDELRELSYEKRAPYWLAVWNRSRVHAALSQVLFFFEDWAQARKKMKKRGEIEFVYDPLWPYLVAMVDRVENWAHSDGLSSLLSAALEERQRERLPLLKKWNRDVKRPWYRRQSIVSLHYYSRSRQKPLASKVTLPMVQALLKDEHFYVQRGVGWTLRECYNVDPAATTTFVRKHVTNLSAIAFSAATEKMPAALKSELKTKRKHHRNVSK